MIIKNIYIDLLHAFGSFAFIKIYDEYLVKEEIQYLISIFAPNVFVFQL